MLKKTIFAISLSAIFAVPSVSHAGTSCKSTWVKANSKLKTFFVPVARLVCNKLNTEDEEAAKKCIEDVEKFADKAEEMKEEWNKGEDGSWKIGPRALPNNSPQTGAVSTERQFVGLPVLNAEYELSLERTGGKAKHDLIVKICFVDANGDDVHYEQVRLNKDGKTKFQKSFKGKEGTYPLIHLNNEKWGTNAHQYVIKGSGSGEASAVVQARETLREANAKKPLKRVIRR
ncbi:MAG: hypothetical protein H6713_36170 [Myxococcales bacterium]|nr:hypothetical protein [Myxococcales bacterium]MCB9755408.1 hypothetical protein [Myxococcales bacterium]